MPDALASQGLSTGQKRAVQVAVVAGLLLLLKNRKTTPAPIRSFGEAQNMSISMGQPPNKAPGELVIVTGVTFDYRGPGGDVLVPWIITKPRTCAGSPFNCNFNNGDWAPASSGWTRGANIVSPASAAVFTPITQSATQLGATFLTPQTDVDLPTLHPGAVVQYGTGLASAWVGVYSENKAILNGVFGNAKGIFHEQAQLITSGFLVADVLNIISAPPSAQNFTMVLANRTRTGIRRHGMRLRQ